MSIGLTLSRVHNVPRSPCPSLPCRAAAAVRQGSDIDARVKLPKTFLAVNLSDAFVFQEKERQNSEADALEMKAVGHKRSAVMTGATPETAEQEASESQKEVEPAEAPALS